jgi:hypothetical protein
MSSWEGHSFDNATRFMGIFCALGFVVFTWILWFVAVPNGNSSDVWIQYIGTAFLVLMGCTSLWMTFSRTSLSDESLSRVFAGWRRNIDITNVAEADYIAVPYTLGTVMLAVRTKQGRKVRFYAPAAVGVERFDDLKKRFPPQSRFLVL